MRFPAHILLLCICAYTCRLLDATLVIQTYAGTGVAGYSGDGGPATNAKLKTSKGVAVMPSGSILIADVENHRIRIVYTNGTIGTFAGTGVAGFSGDNGLATRAQLNQPTGIHYVQAGTLQGMAFISDMNNHRIRKVNANGTITTFAGTGTAAYSGNGVPATNAALNFPQGVAVDAAGNVYIADFFNNIVRIVKVVNGWIFNFAGKPGFFGGTGDNGQATSALLSLPRDVALDAADTTLYIADSYNFVVRRVVISSGIITTYAGKMQAAGFSGDGGPATSAKLNITRGVAVDAQGVVYIGDFGNNRVRQVWNGTISTLAGTGQAACSGDGGAPANASLNGPRGVAVDGSSQRVYIGDADSNRVRVVITIPSLTPSASLSPSYTPTPSVSASFTRTLTGTMTAKVTASKTVTPTRTPSHTGTGAKSPSPLVTPTSTLSQHATPYPTATVTPTASYTASHTPTSSYSATESASYTSSATSSNSPTASFTPSLSSSESPSTSVTPSPSSSATCSATGNATNSPSESPTRTSTNTVTRTASFTPTALATAGVSYSNTMSAASSAAGGTSGSVTGGMSASPTRSPSLSSSSSVGFTAAASPAMSNGTTQLPPEPDAAQGGAGADGLVVLVGGGAGAVMLLVVCVCGCCIWRRFKKPKPRKRVYSDRRISRASSRSANTSDSEGLEFTVLAAKLLSATCHIPPLPAAHQTIIQDAIARNTLDGPLASLLHGQGQAIEYMSSTRLEDLEGSDLVQALVEAVDSFTFPAIDEVHTMPVISFPPIGKMQTNASITSHQVTAAGDVAYMNPLRRGKAEVTTGGFPSIPSTATSIRADHKANLHDSYLPSAALPDQGALPDMEEYSVNPMVAQDSLQSEAQGAPPSKYTSAGSRPSHTAQLLQHRNTAGEVLHLNPMARSKAGAVVETHKPLMKSAAEHTMQKRALAQAVMASLQASSLVQYGGADSTKAGGTATSVAVDVFQASITGQVSTGLNTNPSTMATIAAEAYLKHGMKEYGLASLDSPSLPDCNRAIEHLESLLAGPLAASISSPTHTAEMRACVHDKLGVLRKLKRMALEASLRSNDDASTRVPAKTRVRMEFQAQMTRPNAADGATTVRPDDTQMSLLPTTSPNRSRVVRHRPSVMVGPRGEERRGEGRVGDVPEPASRISVGRPSFVHSAGVADGTLLIGKQRAAFTGVHARSIRGPSTRQPNASKAESSIPASPDTVVIAAPSPPLTPVKRTVRVSVVAAAAAPHASSVPGALDAYKRSVERTGRGGRRESTVASRQSDAR